MRVQHETMLLRQLHEAAHHWLVRLLAAVVEFPQRDVRVLLQSLLDVQNDRLVAYPTGDFSLRAVRPQFGNDQVGRLGVKLLRAVIAGT